MPRKVVVATAAGTAPVRPVTLAWQTGDLRFEGRRTCGGGWEHSWI
jgi:hypothetical protein